MARHYKNIAGEWRQFSVQGTYAKIRGYPEIFKGMRIENGSGIGPNWRSHCQKVKQFELCPAICTSVLTWPKTQRVLRPLPESFLYMSEIIVCFVSHLPLAVILFLFI